SDHFRRHEKIIATPPTIAMIRLRNRNQKTEPLSFGSKLGLEDVTIELFPAGHILGSAQILVVKDGVRLVYSGDFKIDRSETAEPIKIQPADILIMECTFGSPEFIFPKRWVIIEKLVKFIESCFQKGQVPVILAYRIGKAQEVIKILGELDYQVSVHASIEPVLNVYQQFNICFKNFQTYHGEDLRNRVLVTPPHLSRGTQVKKIWNARKLILSGWAIQKNSRFRYGADEALTFSDHADYRQLLEFVHQVNPQRVFITHGFEKFIFDLRREGFKADLLQKSSQLPLF
ncbi:MAG: MBL fold metallo-hydrolase RNA specificity domain-containing protein, partial [bacterium]|nr:MBL fold metallo-hydrolase RNA specificity domain-containing protein [bacterium]